MKKLIIYILMLCLAAVLLSSCVCAPRLDQLSEQQEEQMEQEQVPEVQEELAVFLHGQDIAYYVQYSSGFTEGTEPVLQIDKEGNFKLLANLYEGMGYVSGVYQAQGNVVVFNVTYIGFYGFAGEDVTEITMTYSEGMFTVDSVVGESYDIVGGTRAGSEFHAVDEKPAYFDNPMGL